MFMPLFFIFYSCHSFFESSQIKVVRAVLLPITSLILYKMTGFIIMEIPQEEESSSPLMMIVNCLLMFGKYQLISSVVSYLSKFIEISV